MIKIYKTNSTVTSKQKHWTPTWGVRGASWPENCRTKERRRAKAKARQAASPPGAASAESGSSAPSPLAACVPFSLAAGGRPVAARRALKACSVCSSRACAPGLGPSVQLRTVATGRRHDRIGRCLRTSHSQNSMLKSFACQTYHGSSSVATKMTVLEPRNSSQMDAWIRQGTMI